jgi:hypothetical protein
MTLEAATVPLDIQTTYIQYCTHIWNSSRYNGSYNNRKERKILNTLKGYHIYKISRNNLNMNDTYILIHTTPYSRYYMRFTQENSTQLPPLPSHYTINAGVGTPNIHKVHAQGTTISIITHAG